MITKYEIFRTLLNVMDNLGIHVSDADMNVYDGSMEISGSNRGEKVTLRVMIEECEVDADAG